MQPGSVGSSFRNRKLKSTQNSLIGAAPTLQATLVRPTGARLVEHSRRYGVVVLPMAFRPDADSLPRFDSPLVQGASRDAVHRLRLNTMQRPGHTGRKALATKKKVLNPKCADPRGFLCERHLGRPGRCI